MWNMTVEMELCSDFDFSLEKYLRIENYKSNNNNRHTCVIDNGIIWNRHTYMI